MNIKKRFPLRAGCMPHGMRMKNGNLWIATMNAPGLIRLDPTTGDTLCINMNGMGVQTACRNAGDYVFVSLYDRCGVMRYTIATGDTLFIPLPSSAQGPIQIYLTPNDSLLLVCDQGMLIGKPAGNMLYFIHPISGVVADSVTVGSGPHGVCTNSLGTRAYVTNTNANTMSMIDLNTKTVLKTVATGGKPNGISFLLCP